MVLEEVFKVFIFQQFADEKHMVYFKGRGNKWCLYGVKLGLSGSGNIGLNFCNIFSAIYFQLIFTVIFNTFIFGINYLMHIFIHENV